MTAFPVHPWLMSVAQGREAPDLVPPPSDPTAWEAIGEQAVRHGLAALCYGKLVQGGLCGRVPPGRLASLKRLASFWTARNLMLARELAVILRGCAARHLPCIPIRGPALAEDLYGEPTLRPMGDLDLLVRREDIAEIAVVLGELGFIEMDRRPGFARAFANTAEFVKEAHGWLTVEPHWSLAYPPFADRLDMDQVWRRSRRGVAVGMDTRVLSRTDLVLHLCFHLSHAAASAPLLWYGELAHLLRRDAGAIDWPEIVRIARATGQAPLVAAVLHTIKDLFDAHMPDALLTELTKAGAERHAHGAGAPLEARLVRLLAEASHVDGRESLALLFALKGVRRKLRYAIGILFPTATFMRLHYGLPGRPRLCYWYLARLAFLTRESVKGLATLLGRVGPSRRSSAG